MWGLATYFPSIIVITEITLSHTPRFSPPYSLLHVSCGAMKQGSLSFPDMRLDFLKPWLECLERPPWQDPSHNRYSWDTRVTKTSPPS